MAYPIKQLNPSEFFRIFVIWSDALQVQTMEDWSAYATGLTFSSGGDVDARRATLQTGLASISFKGAPYDNTRKYTRIYIDSVEKKTGVYPYQIFYGEINDVDSVKTIQNGEVLETVSISARDLISWTMDREVLDGWFLPNLGETKQLYEVADGLISTCAMWNRFVNGLTTTAINGGFTPMPYADQWQILADTTKTYPRAINQVTYTAAGIPAAAGSTGLERQSSMSLCFYNDTTTPTLIASDGSHTSGTPNLFYTDIEVSGGTKTSTGGVDLTNLGLARGTYPTGNTASLQGLDIPYSAGSGGGRRLELTTCAVSDNLGWNFLSNTGNNPNKPTTWRTSGFHKFQVLATPIRNDRPTVTVTSTNTFASGAAALYFASDLTEVFALNPGGTTGNYYFRVYMATVSGRAVTFTPVIYWYDSSDTLVSTSTGTGVALTSSWQALGVNAAKPASAAYGIPAVTTAQSFAKTTTVAYISDAYFGRQGAYKSFDGDVPDDTTYLYTWTGERWNSPSQLNSATNVVALADYWAARASSRVPVARKITFNMSSAKTTFMKIMDSLNDYTRPYQSTDNVIKVWFDGVAKDYDIVAYDVTLDKDNSQITFTLLDKG